MDLPKTGAAPEREGTAERAGGPASRRRKGQRIGKLSPSAVILLGGSMARTERQLQAAYEKEDIIA